MIRILLIILPIKNTCSGPVNKELTAQLGVWILFSLGRTLHTALAHISALKMMHVI